MQILSWHTGCSIPRRNLYWEIQREKANMRFPFFRSSKVEPAKVVAPPRPAPRTPPFTPSSSAPRSTQSPAVRRNLQLAETQLMSNPVNAAAQASRQSAEVPADNQRVPATNGRTIPISLSSISQQLPANFLSALTPDNISRVSVNIPADWIIPQLAQGRVTITLADLLPLLPEDVARRPFPTGNSQHAIVLPLADMVTSLPMDLLQHQNQTAIDLDTPEFAQFPKLVDDSNEIPVVEKPVESEETVAIAAPAAAVSEVVAESFES